MAERKNPLDVVGPALVTAGCVTVAAAGAVASQGETVGATSAAKTDGNDNVTAGRYDDLSPDWS